MKTIEIKLPEPIFRQAQELALSENIAVDELLTLAVSQMLGMWRKEREINADKKHNSRQQFLEMLEKALDGEQPGASDAR